MVRPDQVCKFGDERARGAAAIPLQAALESGAGIFGAVEGKLAVGQPLVGGDRLRRRHFLRDGLGHVLGEIHHVIGRQFCQFARGPGLAADRACCLSSPRSCDGNRRAGNHARLAARGACRRWPRASSSTIDNACAAAAAPRARDARDLRASASAAHRRCRTAAAAGRRTARSSARPIETHRAAPARTRRRPNCRNHARPRRRRWR